MPIIAQQICFIIRIKHSKIRKKIYLRLDLKCIVKILFIIMTVEKFEIQQE